MSGASSTLALDRKFSLTSPAKLEKSGSWASTQERSSPKSTRIALYPSLTARMSCSMTPQLLSSLFRLVALAADANNVRISACVQIRVLTAYSSVICRHSRSILLDEDRSIVAAKSIMMTATGTIMNAISASKRVLRWRNADKTFITRSSSRNVTLSEGNWLSGDRVAATQFGFPARRRPTGANLNCSQKREK